MTNIIYGFVFLIVFGLSIYLLKNIMENNELKQVIESQNSTIDHLEQENQNLRYYADTYENTLEILKNVKQKERIIEKHYQTKVEKQYEIIEQAIKDDDFNAALSNFDDVFELHEDQNSLQN